MSNHPTQTGETRQTTPTDDTARDAGQAYRDFARHVALTLVVLAVLGFLPTRRFAGDPGLVAMAVALGTAVAASLAGTLPIWRSRGQHPSYSVPAQLGAMALRLLVVLVLGVAIASTGLLPLPAFLIWLATGHSTLLIADTLFARSITAHAMHHSTHPSSMAPTE